MVKAPQRAQDVGINELEDAVEFVQAIFKRCAGQHKGVRAAQPLDGVGGFGAPVLDTLRLVQDDEVRPQAAQIFFIAQHQFVVDDVEEGRVLVKTAAGFNITLDDVDRERGKTLNLSRPLVFERSGADHQHALDIAQLVQKAAGGDGLHRFAQAHIVCQHSPAAKGQVHGTLFLVRVERCGEEVEGAMATLDLRQEPLFLALNGFDVLQPFQISLHPGGYLDRIPLPGGQGFEVLQQSGQSLDG